MTNYQKYFGTSELAAETLENIIFGKIKVCSDFCNFSNCEPDCANNQLLDDYDCCNGIKVWLEKDEDEITG